MTHKLPALKSACDCKIIKPADSVTNRRHYYVDCCNSSLVIMSRRMELDNLGLNSSYHTDAAWLGPIAYLSLTYL